MFVFIDECVYKWVMHCVNISGTTERVCLIMGPVEAVRQVHNFVMEKIREKPDPNPKMDETKSTFERHRQVCVPVDIHCSPL